MFVDRMHTDAIRAADASMLPQTVYRDKGGWHHAEALWMRAQLRDAKTNGVVLVVTWLPERFFD